jgi:hypothetical protein
VVVAMEPSYARGKIGATITRVDSDTAIRRARLLKTSTLALAGIIAPIWFTTVVIVQAFLLPDCTDDGPSLFVTPQPANSPSRPSLP